jgi:uncharacterized protein YbjT (DUF2867 family)
MSKVFVTGATGFIGKRLLFQLLDQGHEVYALSRIRGIPIGNFTHPNLHVIYGDLKDLEKMEPLPSDLDGAYYLIHSMAEKVDNLLEHEQSTAHNFVQLIEKTTCKHIIYLGGIIAKDDNLSKHLLSRKQVEEELKTSKIPVTILRASIIIGAGSASFEIIRDLVEKLPIMIAPKWVTTKCQPISIVDVLYYLSSTLLNEKMYHNTYDVGGPDVMTFKQVLMRYSKFRGLRRLLIEVPVLTPRLSSYWLVFISSVRFSLCSYLIESMRHNTICSIGNIKEIIPHECQNFEATLERAFMKISQNEVVSTWMDAWQIEELDPEVSKYIELPKEGCLKDIQIYPLECSKQESIKRIWRLGGEHGWYSLDWAWRLRGLIDKILGGAGMNRGRRHPFELEIGDSLDFWRVVQADKEKGHLILYAEMKLPGEAWLEFSIKGNTLHQIALFRPKGLLGRLYWYSMLPFHFIIFKKMAQNLSELNDK